MSKIVVQPPIEHIPNLKEYQIDKLSLERSLPHDRIWQGVRLFYDKYFYVCHEDWGKVFRDVLCNLPKYNERFTCSGFAFVTKARVHERYHLNGIAMVTGDHPEDGHAWIWFFDELGWHQLEPQNADVFDIDQQGYIALWLIA